MCDLHIYSICNLPPFLSLLLSLPLLPPSLPPQPTGPLARNEKRITHLCVSNKQDLMAWITGIRLAKVGSI